MVLAETPEAYRHSSYGGYARKSRQVDWVAYEEHHRYSHWTPWRQRSGLRVS